MIFRGVCIVACVLTVAASAAAQSRAPAAEGPPNAMQGFSKNKSQPVHIEAGRLEVRDKDKVATFIGNVQVNQGDTAMRCQTLTVYYEGGPNDGKDAKGAKDEKPAAATATAATLGGSPDQRIKKLEAKGGVVVTQNDQVATGDAAMFDMRTNVVTMSGNVVLTQGQNVLRGSRLVVDMNTGNSRIESGEGGNGRVQGLFVPSSSQRPGLPGLGKPAPGNAPPAR